MVGPNIPHCFSMHDIIMWKGVGRHKGQTNKPTIKLSLVFHISCFVFYLHVLCFIFIFKNETQQWWVAGAMFLLILLRSSLHKHNNNKKGSMTNTQEGEKEQKSRGGEEGVFTTHLKGRRWRLMMVGASIPCRSFLHNRTRNHANNEKTKTKTISLVGGNHSSPFFLAQTQQQEGDHI